ncbi:MAG: PhoX family phosphatase [Thiomicrorhabdus sp.]|nr:PhoX family phosphatase [Thiomicrorhabdus sp.]
MSSPYKKNIQNLSKLSCDEFDEVVRPAPEKVAFDDVVEKGMSRRDFFKGSALLFGSSLFVKSSLVQAMSSSVESSFNMFSFENVKANSEDSVTLPKDYQWQPLVSWGDLLWSKTSDNLQEFDDKNLLSSKTQEFAFGDNNDGMKHFNINGHELLAINNEYINFKSFYRNRTSGLPESEEDTLKAKLAVGVSIVEIKKNKNGWQVVQDSKYNRRIHALTPMQITGPAKGHELMKTSADPEGELSLGTWNNCGSGKTPWGTYLTCEENFNGFYLSSNPDINVSDELKRYGVTHQDRGYAWGKYDERFDLAITPNEPNRSGYVVEIDPANPDSIPKKRTALGRFKHENAEMVIADSGHVVVYLGDDERGEYLYRYVSKNTYHKGADIDDLMENGTLYVAKFYEDGSGKWLALTSESTGMPMAEICIHTRQAASKVDATTMDRPEWVAVNPNKVEVFCALTNNKNRGVKTNKGGDAQPVGGVNPRQENHYGQVVRWIPNNSNHTAEGFNWNLFVLAGNPEVHKDNLYAGSANVHSGNMFNAPDGVHFDSQGKLWIQTDGKYSNKGDYAGMGNNQMLLANPQTGEIKRFMVGPKECEVTGFAYSEDKKTIFVGIQHPGEKGDSNFPYGGVARSTVVAIWHKDGHVIA